MIPKSLIDEIKRWVEEKKYGNIQINFAGGKIVNYNRFESVKIEFIVKGTIQGNGSFSEAGQTLVP